MIKVAFGQSESCEVALGEYTVLAPHIDAHPPLHDLEAAVRAALAAPRNFPPLASAIVPGDRVAVALGKNVPQARDILRGVIGELVAAGVEPHDITVVSAEPPDAGDALPAALGIEGVQFETHNADDEKSLAMVGMTAAHRPLRLNRTLAEADFVLPVAAARATGEGAAPARFSGLFPRFSNRETINRFFAGAKGAPAPGHAERVAESDEAGWLLGVAMEVLVVPGPNSCVCAVVAGEPKSAVSQAADLSRDIWERPAPQRADLVIAAVAGDAGEQTWSNLARAVASSEKVRGPEGAIAVCCEVDEEPAGAFEELRDAVDFAAVAHKLAHGAAAGARQARVLAQALDRGPVYLRSRLPAEVVESLGMTPIESDAELSRLASGRRHCVVIEEAQRVRPRLVGGANGME